MLKVTLSRIEHRGAVRIKVAFPFNQTAIDTIKKIPNSKWSQTKNCWYVPYSTQSYDLLKQYFEVNILKNQIDFAPKKDGNTSIQKSRPVQTTPLSNRHKPTSFVEVLPEQANRVKVIIPYNHTDFATKIKTLPDRIWDEAQGSWSVPQTQATLDALRELFGNSLKVATSINWNHSSQVRNKNNNKSLTIVDQNKKAVSFQSKDTSTSNATINFITGNKLVIERENENWLRVYVPFRKKGWIAVVKSMLGRRWDAEAKYWLIPYVKDNINRINSFIGEEHFECSFDLKTNIPATYKTKQSKKKRSPYNLNNSQKKALISLEEQLQLENKSWRTIKTYKNLFRQYLAYFPDTAPSKISKAQIEHYVVYRKQDNISDSQLNQLINVLNCFYIRLLEQEDKIVRLQRPKKKKKLPNVYSLEEIQALLKSTTNLKHKCMLVLIYSGGLRRSELLNLKVEDVSFDRKTLFVQNGKGGKDRYTFFSDVAQKYLKEYLRQYQPSYYLFEGQHGGKYSESSIQKVFDTARKASNVPGNVTIHGLRHSFATHLIEKSVPLHVVQELLGHNSIKTTEIYLHISNKFRKELKSPLDDLEI